MASGYHAIVSVMQSVTLADELSIAPARDLTLKCDDPDLENEGNLALRAARLLQKKGRVRDGARLCLTKNIPVAAGLGGGSADAAAALLGLNRFWGLNLDPQELMPSALELGSDVPFCLTGGTALVTGIGERVEALPHIDLGRFLIAKPDDGLSSGQVYEAFDRQGTKQAVNVEPMVEAIKSGERETFLAAGANDLEKPALSLLPSIGLVKTTALANGAVFAQVSGSGPAIIIVAHDEGALGNITAALLRQSQTWYVECVRHSVTAIDSTPDNHEN